MMIEIAKGNLLTADVEALVNTVNCMGYMGKGIALQFKKAFPANFEAYAAACRAKRVLPGRMFVFPTQRLNNPKYIINFPTKRHWRGASRFDDIESGLKALALELHERQIKSVAIPPLGCGLGGLDWGQVRPAIEKALAGLPGVTVLLYPPKGAPAASEMPIGTEKPGLTPARALLLALMGQYTQMAYRMSLLEIQKMCYFLQEAGEELRLKFDKAFYGPYAPNLNKVLERLEGHFTRGYGDSQKPDTDIALMPGAVEEALKFLEKSATKEQMERLDKVRDLIAGFETPYGMELLSSLHWLGKHETTPATNHNAAVLALQAWNKRKRKIFRSEHAHIAWDQLKQHGFLEH
ncbi:MAG: macro domain-containing protein [Thermodesulfobacteriota bacterium]